MTSPVLPILPALPALVTEFMPAVRLSTHATALDAFLAAGCPDSLAARAAVEVEAQGGCTSVPATAVALGHAPFAAVQHDDAGAELAAVMRVEGGFGLFLAAPLHATPDLAAMENMLKEATRLTGRRWVGIERQRLVGFGPQGWQA